MKIMFTRERVVLWLSLLFGALLVPFALIAFLDLSSALLTEPPDLPKTPGQWVGFITAIAVIIGAAMGLTARSHHLTWRKMAHLLIAALGVVLIGRAPLAGWVR
jgi:hypothetical protein